MLSDIDINLNVVFKCGICDSYWRGYLSKLEVG